MHFDNQKIMQLREDCQIHDIDFSRAKLEALGDGFVVTFAAALFDLGPMLDGMPMRVEAKSPASAEGELLSGLLKIQRAERQRVRNGRVYGWSPEQLSRAPLTTEEIASYRAEVKHRGEVKKLQSELADALEKAASASERKRGAERLAEHYGLAPAKPVRADTSTDTAVPAGTSPQVKNRKQKVKS